MRGAPGNWLLASSDASTAKGRFPGSTAARRSVVKGRFIMLNSCQDFCQRRFGFQSLRLRRHDPAYHLRGTLSQSFARPCDEAGHVGDSKTYPVHVAFGRSSRERPGESWSQKASVSLTVFDPIAIAG